MFEFINMETGESVIDKAEYFTAFSILSHIMTHKIFDGKITPTAKLSIENAINSGKPAAWYNGVYVRRIG